VNGRRFGDVVRASRRWPLIALVITTALVLSVRAVAYAHATLVSSEPTANSRLATSPTRVRLVFSEQVEPSLAQVSIVASANGVTPLTVGGDVHDVHAIIAPVGTLGPGAYRLRWRVVSADGHPVEGSFAFWVGASQTQAAPDSAASIDEPATWGPTFKGAPLIPSTLRGVGLGSLMALGGLLLFLSFSRASSRRATRLTNGLALAAAVFLTLHLAAWILNVTPAHSLASDSTTVVLTSRVGKVELWRTGLAVLALWAVWLARRPRLALVIAIAALVVSGASGHSAAMQPFWAVPAKATHLLAGAAWLGGLLWLLVADRSDTRAFAREASRVSTIALTCVVLVMLSGVLQAWLFLPSPWDVFRSSYGTVVLAKVAGLVVLIAFGAAHRYRVLPRLERDAAMPGRFATSLGREIGVMFIVVLLGGLLAYLSPPHPPEHMMSSTHSAVPE
jgi:copper transport protein